MTAAGLLLDHCWTALDCCWPAAELLLDWRWAPPRLLLDCVGLLLQGWIAAALLHCCRTVAGQCWIVLDCSLSSAGVLLECCWSFAGVLLDRGWTAATLLLDCCWISAKQL